MANGSAADSRIRTHDSTGVHTPAKIPELFGSPDLPSIRDYNVTKRLSRWRGDAYPTEVPASQP